MLSVFKKFRDQLIFNLFLTSLSCSYAIVCLVVRFSIFTGFFGMLAVKTFFFSCFDEKRNGNAFNLRILITWFVFECFVLADVVLLFC